MAFLKAKESKLYDTDTRKLIKSITKFQEDDENFRLCMDFALSNFLYHPYLDADSHKIQRTLTGLHEKYLVKSNLEKANNFQSTYKKLLNIFNSKLSHEKEQGFRVLALLLHLSKADHSVDSVSCNDLQSKSSVIECGNKLENFDWVAYLQEGEKKYGPLSDYSDTFSTDDDDSFEEIDGTSPRPSRNPPRDDSGIGISPDSCSGTSSQPIFQSSNDLQYYSRPVHVDPAVAESYAESKYLYWIAGYQETYSRCPYNLTTVNFTKVWEEQMLKEQPCLIIQRKVIVHERNVVREVLWMLNGIKDLFIFNWDGEKFSASPSVHLCNLTSPTLGTLLEEFCGHGNKAALLRNFAEQVLLSEYDLRTPCKTYQAYAEAVQQLLQKFSVQMCNLEKVLKLKKETFTLLILREKLEDPMSDINVIYQIHEEVLRLIPETCEPYERAVRLLHILWKHVSQQCFWISSSSAMKTVLNIFLKTCYPYFSYLEEFMFHGVIRDPCSEFIVIRKLDVKVLQENFWCNAFQLRSLPRDIEADFFLKPIFQNILITGKSIEMLHQINVLQKQSPFRLHSKKDELYLKFVYVLKNLLRNKISQKTKKEALVVLKDRNSESKESQEIQVQQDPLLEEKIFEFFQPQYFQPKVNPTYVIIPKEIPESYFTDEQLQFQRILGEMEPNILKPLNLDIEKALKICMKYACYPTCKKLMEALREHHQLMKHMLVMKKYFLMESGDVMFSFYSKVFEKIFSNDEWQDVSFLCNTLGSAICDDKEISKRLCIFLDTSREGVQSQEPLSFLNSLQLSYEVEWPISIMLGTKAQNQYGLIFCFLLQIKCAKYILDELYCKGNSLDTAEKGRTTLMKLLARDEFPRRQKIHGMYIIRMRLMYFINGFHNYIMTRILHSFGVEFSRTLENASTLEEMISAHNLYLKSLHQRCLLDPRLPYLKEYIFRVLNLAIPFQRLWRRGVDSITLEELQNIEMEFSTCNNFLISYLNKPLKRGAYPHLETLSSAMLSNSHLLHVFGSKKEVPTFPFHSKVKH